jgi:two-component system, sensor histidine kinase YesM
MIRKWLGITRNQIFLGFFSAMIIVLAVTILIAYSTVSNLLQKNANNYTEEIAGQINGRVDALLGEVDTLTLQLASDDRIQSVLYDAKKGQMFEIADRLNYVRPILVRTESFSSLIKSLDLYAMNRSLYPIVSNPLSERIDPKWIAEADSNSGKLVWAGIDPQNKERIIGIRQIRLEQDNYQSGGYLVVSLTSSLFDFLGDNVANIEGSSLYFLNQKNEIVSAKREPNSEFAGDLLANDQALIVSSNGTEYIKIKRASQTTGWNIVLLLPRKKITEGISILRSILAFSSLFGLILFTLLSYVLSTMITHPLRKLTKIMKAARDGNVKLNPDRYYNLEINDLNLTYNKMVGNLNRLIDEVYKQEILKMKSEIRSLHSQLNPHFLYNTLEAFYWNLIEAKQDALASYVIQLAELFRYTIKKNNENEFAKVEDEVEHVKRYLNIMSMRMGTRLNWTLEVDEEISWCKIPKLLIQPLVENAVLHGVEPQIGNGMIAIQVIYLEEQNEIQIVVEDNGTGIPVDRLEEIRTHLAEGRQLQAKRSGIGLYNIHKYIELYYGKSYGIHLDNRTTGGTVVTVTLPARR